MKPDKASNTGNHPIDNVLDNLGWIVVGIGVAAAVIVLSLLFLLGAGP